MTIHPLVQGLFKAWKSGEKTYGYELKGKDAERYYSALRKLDDYKLPERANLSERHIANGYLFKEGALFAYTEDYFTEEESQVFQRFTNVFTLTYSRYLDLKQAEAREEDAVKQASLDRVRAEIASMRNTDDLQRITPLVWRELGSLGVPFFRCGIFIMDESVETVHMYLSTPTGEPLAAMDLGFDESAIPMVQEAVFHWKTQTVHVTHWDRQQFMSFTESLKKRRLIKSLKTYQLGEQPPESLNLHFVPFNQGMLYVGSSQVLEDDQIELVHSLAEAFSVAYARYEDFVKLEEAMKRVENTLTELKSAQNQLIHSEKMASLGELTAGIAHEIQNPLNFVNNFSEVSGELIEELKNEIQAGNLKEALEIGQDLIQNIEKINHHGQRASSIVKGMLQHSRSGSDQKELTDINSLTDEYLRLAYHGFRAKDKSFNANYKTELADGLPKLNVVPQDIGRVLLNLINNAFQAVRDVEKPEVVVGTKHGAKSIEVSVKDNGPGIPEGIKEKIFQPFFTTKPAGEGTGLGLSLSYDIVTKGHGGKLMLNTPANGKAGTEFVIFLPVNL
jgi:signal transduction histidine kinase